MEEPGWDIRLVCTCCGMEKRRSRNDHNGVFLNDTLPIFVQEECYNCSGELGTDIITDHFVNIVNDKFKDIT